VFHSYFTYTDDARSNTNQVIRLSALCTGYFYPPGSIPDTHFFSRLSRTHWHSTTRRIMSMKNSSGIIGNRTRNLPAYNTMPQPTAPPCIPTYHYKNLFKHKVYHHRICFYEFLWICTAFSLAIYIYIYIYMYQWGCRIHECCLVYYCKCGYRNPITFVSKNDHVTQVYMSVLFCCLCARTLIQLRYKLLVI
jgi:hypothetical protein